MCMSFSCYSPMKDIGFVVSSQDCKSCVTTEVMGWDTNVATVQDRISARL